jgi:hypothetical protein
VQEPGFLLGQKIAVQKFLEIESFQGGGSNLTPTFYMLAVVYVQQLCKSTRPPLATGAPTAQSRFDRIVGVNTALSKQAAAQVSKV